MPGIQKRTISLRAEHAAWVDELVARGDYSSVSEVVREGLRALRQRNEAVEKWLREEVAPAVANESPSAKPHAGTGR
ncbi:type II toxin-antitoxin system ParD family antitoxin [Afifella sp. IM 167]|uniref:type II toxin-antitoxin system ParD family antitoxin n=1 Tax=Afifella sp. IM 167 TaxID=2033586 RepID=UPI001CCCC2CB|nr:type II toxin-antitoxin system ParD family antitoxin [Afifella sp. IM 167]MBZ8133643.1 type II toxin-antitoxin system ParD family antitoxin [Afifella sp. IM 167]